MTEREPAGEQDRDYVPVLPDVIVHGSGEWDYGPGPSQAKFSGLWPPEDGSRPQISGRKARKTPRQDDVREQ